MISIKFSLQSQCLFLCHPQEIQDKERLEVLPFWYQNSSTKMYPNNGTFPNLFSAHQTEVISDAVFSYLAVIFKMVLNPILCVLGFCTNVINAAVFFRMGLSDGVTQNFFILAVSDGLNTAVLLTNSFAFIGQKIFVAYSGYSNLAVIAQIVYRASYSATLFPYYLSIITTTVIAIVRCCCVAMPLKVKYLLTARRQLAAIFLLSGTSHCVLIYILSSVYLNFGINSLTNTTIAYYGGVNSFWSTVLANSIFGGCFITVTICLIILSVSLARASKFRHSSTMATPVPGRLPSVSGSSNLSRDKGRDARIVRTVVLISAIFIVSNIPIIMFFILRITLTGFVPFGENKNASEFMMMMVETFALFNVIANIFIYVFFNTRYRTTFNAMFKSLK